MADALKARDPRRYVLFFVLAFLPRLAYLLWARPPFHGAYWALADSLLEDGSLAIDGAATTAYEPLYPMFLAAARLLAREHLLIVQLLQTALASLGAVFLYRLARALTGRSTMAAASALLYAIDPLLVRQAVEHSEAPLITTLLIAFTYWFVTVKTGRDAWWTGASLGFAVLARSMVLPMVVLGAGVLLAARRYRAALALTAGALLVVAPMLVRNHRVDGSWLPTRGGLNLFVGNSPYTAALLPEYDVDLLEPYAYSIVEQESRASGGMPNGDQAPNAILTRYALAYMREAPLRTIRQKITNVWYFFSPRLVPYQTRTDDTRLVFDSAGRVRVENSRARPLGEIIAYTVSYSIVLACSLVGVCLRGRRLRQDAILWCLVGTFVAVAAVYFPATRYRGPMSFVMLLYAAITLDHIADLLTRPRVAPEEQAGLRSAV